MADSLRQQIINAVDTRFKTITTSNGYETSIGSNVFEWREKALQDEELPAIEYRDIGQEVNNEDVAIGQHGYDLEIEVKVTMKAGTAFMTDMRKAIADIIKAIGVGVTWGGLAIDTEPVSDEVMFSEDEKKITGAKITFIINYRTSAWNPY